MPGPRKLARARQPGWLDRIARPTQAGARAATPGRLPWTAQPSGPAAAGPTGRAVGARWPPWRARTLAGPQRGGGAGQGPQSLPGVAASVIIVVVTVGSCLGPAGRWRRCGAESGYCEGTERANMRSGRRTRANAGGGWRFREGCRALKHAGLSDLGHGIAGYGAAGGVSCSSSAVPSADDDPRSRGIASRSRVPYSAQVRPLPLTARDIR